MLFAVVALCIGLLTLLLKELRLLLVEHWASIRQLATYNANQGGGPIPQAR